MGRITDRGEQGDALRREWKRSIRIFDLTQQMMWLMAADGGSGQHSMRHCRDQLRVDSLGIDCCAPPLIIALGSRLLHVRAVFSAIACNALEHAVLLAAASVVQLRNKTRIQLVLLAESYQDREGALEERRREELVGGV